MKTDWRNVYSPCPCAWCWRVCSERAGTSLTPGVPGKISALCLSLSLPLPHSSLPPSFFLSLTCVFPTDTPLSSPPSHLHAYRPCFYPSKTKATQIMCVWICSRAWVSNAQWKMYFCILYGWVERYFSSLKLMFGVSAFDREKTFWNPFMVYKCTVY